MSSGDREERILALVQENADLRAQLSQCNEDIARLQQLVDVDPLLPLLNRRAFLREADRAWASSVRHDYGLALVFLDIDGLKAINDTYGHAAGDAALSHVGEVLLANTRAGDLAGRMGGDEFAVLLSHIEPGEARAKASNLCELIQSRSMAAGEERIAVSVTCGVCSRDGHTDLASLLRTADERMLLAKRGKR